MLAIACAGGLIGFCVHNQLDAGNIWKAPPVTLAAIGAIIVRNYRESVGDVPRVFSARVPGPVMAIGMFP